jgi:hypothetical protein
MAKETTESKKQSEEAKKQSEEAKKQVAELDFNFIITDFKGNPVKALRDEVLKKLREDNTAYNNGNDLKPEHYRDIKVYEQLSSFIGSSSKDFNDRAWEWRINLMNDKSLTLDKSNLKTLNEFVKELLKEGKLTNDSYYLNYKSIFETATKELE